MKIELFLDNFGLVNGFRMNWKQWAKTKPNPRLVFEIRRSDVIPLTHFLAGRPVALGTESKHDAKFGHRLFLTALDLANPQALKDTAFLKHFE